MNEINIIIIVSQTMVANNHETYRVSTKEVQTRRNTVNVVLASGNIPKRTDFLEINSIG